MFPDKFKFFGVLHYSYMFYQTQTKLEFLKAISFHIFLQIISLNLYDQISLDNSNEIRIEFGGEWVV